MRLLPPARLGGVSMDMIIAPLPFRRQKGAPIVASRPSRVWCVIPLEWWPTLGEPASESWMGGVDGGGGMGIEDGCGQVRTGADG